MLETVQAWGTGNEATVWVTGERVSAQAAAIVNAYQIHCLEYDCVHEGAVVHPMATVLSTMMAYAERRSLRGQPISGSEFLVAMVVGIDIAAYLGMAATGPVRFFRPATAGGLGATAAISFLEGLDPSGIKSAMGNMVSLRSSSTPKPPQVSAGRLPISMRNGMHRKEIKNGESPLSTNG